MDGRATVGLGVMAPKLGYTREKKNERLGAQRRRSGSRRPGVGFPWCSSVPIAVAGTMAASLGWLWRCSGGHSGNWSCGDKVHARGTKRTGSICA
ncbi:hypothetical protein DEO72_LG11g3648 [Vigna unguiculata]|uniref:Uncharacterized protein n=1 Tax=Vigna unguiculata TaxID=3917 RepID=A0A4D6NUI0_VIGUN|nr:hypothetical protein DEO72_LG11g3648 [Vigna unguiculata]